MPLIIQFSTIQSLAIIFALILPAFINLLIWLGSIPSCSYASLTLYITALKENISCNIAITSIRVNLLSRGYVNCHERQIVKEARDLGFEIVKPKNKAHIKINSIDELKRIIEKNSYSLEDFFEEEEISSCIIEKTTPVTKSKRLAIHSLN